MTIAKRPLAKGIDDFDFAGTPVNKTLVRDIASGDFLLTQRNAMLIGGTGTGKSHLAIAIARTCIRKGSYIDRTCSKCESDSRLNAV